MGEKGEKQRRMVLWKGAWLPGLLWSASRPLTLRHRQRRVSSLPGQTDRAAAATDSHSENHLVSSVSLRSRYGIPLRMTDSLQSLVEAPSAPSFSISQTNTIVLVIFAFPERSTLDVRWHAVYDPKQLLSLTSIFNGDS